MNTKLTALVLAVVFVVATLVLTSAGRADSLRCGTRLVEVGDNAETLFETCGSPIYRVMAHYVGGETWYYDRGSSQFTTKVVILGGKIIAIEDHDYGVSALSGPRM